MCHSVQVGGPPPRSGTTTHDTLHITVQPQPRHWFTPPPPEITSDRDPLSYMGLKCDVKINWVSYVRNDVLFCYGNALSVVTLNWLVFQCFSCQKEILTKWYVFKIWLLIGRPNDINFFNVFLPPANVVCEGYVFTCVCLSTGGQDLGRYPPGIKYTPWAGTPIGTRYTPRTRYTPVGPGAPLRQVHPPGTRYTPLGRYTPWTRYTPSRYTP